MISLFMARAGFERRICLSSLEQEQSAGGAALSESPVAQPFLEPQDRISVLLDLLSGAIKTIRSGDYQVLIYLCSGMLNICPSVQWRRFSISPRTVLIHTCKARLLSIIPALDDMASASGTRAER